MNDLQPVLALWQSRLRRRLRADSCLLAAVGLVMLTSAPLLRGQVPTKGRTRPSAPSVASPATKIATVKSFRLVQEKDGSAVEILSTQPLVPSIQAITDPDRLVIDLPNARVDIAEKRISVNADQITSPVSYTHLTLPTILRV